MFRRLLFRKINNAANRHWTTEVGEVSSVLLDQQRLFASTQRLWGASLGDDRQSDETASETDRIIHEAIHQTLEKKKALKSGIQLPVLASSLPEEILETMEESLKSFTERHPKKYFLKKTTDGMTVVMLLSGRPRAPEAQSFPVKSTASKSLGSPSFTPPPPPPKPTATAREAAIHEMKMSAIVQTRTLGSGTKTILPPTPKKSGVLADRSVPFLTLNAKELNELMSQLHKVANNKKFFWGLNKLMPIVDEVFLNDTSSILSTNSVAVGALKAVVKHSKPIRCPDEDKAASYWKAGAIPLLHFVAIRKNWESYLANQDLNSAQESTPHFGGVYSNALNFSCLNDLPTTSPTPELNKRNAQPKVTYSDAQEIDPAAFQSQNKHITVISGTILLHNLIERGDIINVADFNFYATMSPEYHYLATEDAANECLKTLIEGALLVQDKIAKRRQYCGENDLSPLSDCVLRLLTAIPKLTSVEDYDCFRVARFVSAETFTPLSELAAKTRDVTSCDLMHILLSAPHIFEFDHQPKTVVVKSEGNSTDLASKHDFDDPYAEYTPTGAGKLSFNAPLAPTTETSQCSPVFASPYVSAVRFKVHRRYLFENLFGVSDGELAEKELVLDETLYRGGRQIANHLRVVYKRQKRVINMMRHRIGKPIESYYDPEVLAYFLYDRMGDQMVTAVDLGNCLPGDIGSRTMPSHVPFLRQFPHLFKFYEIPRRPALVLRADITGPQLPEETLTEESLVQTIQSIVYRNLNAEVTVSNLTRQIPHFVLDKIKSLGFKDLKSYLTCQAEKKVGFSLSKKFLSADVTQYEFLVRSLEIVNNNDSNADEEGSEETQADSHGFRTSEAKDTLEGSMDNKKDIQLQDSNRASGHQGFKRHKSNYRGNHHHNHQQQQQTQQQEYSDHRNQRNQYGNGDATNRHWNHRSHHEQQTHPNEPRRSQQPDGHQGGWNVGGRGSNNNNNGREVRVSGASPLERLVHSNDRPFTHKL